MIQLTKRLVMTADKHCYIVGEPRQRAGRALEIREPKYYTTAMRAAQGALTTAMRMAVEDNGGHHPAAVHPEAGAIAD